MLIMTIAMTAWMTADDDDDHGHGNRRDQATPTVPMMKSHGDEDGDDDGDGDGECGGEDSDEQTGPVTLGKQS